MRSILIILYSAILVFFGSCSKSSEAPVSDNTSAPKPSTKEYKTIAPTNTSQMPNLQSELLDNRNKTSASPLTSIDFRNYSYPLPRGWQNPDNSDARLINGRLEPVSVAIHEEMSDEEKSAARAARRIGMSYVATKFMDATGDGEDEAFVILKVETTGSAIPQFVYVYSWKGSEPELLWYFRTGDRADGGLKDLRVEDGKLIVELYGQDRFLLGETETGKVTGDEEQLCCPTHFTRTTYKWNGKSFMLDKDRWTYLVSDRSSPPQRNVAEIVNAKERSRKPSQN